MFEATNDIYKEEISAAGKYLTELGLELSDLIEINGISVVRSSFWGKTHVSDMHGIYSLAPYEIEQGLIIHVQAYPTLSSDPSDPLLSAWIREEPEFFANKYIRADNTPVLRTLLPQDNYGKDIAATAKLIADRV